MKLRPSPYLQFNLLLEDPIPAELSTNKNEELVHALMEMLIGAAMNHLTAGTASGGQSESKTHD
jgi:hypothetical protein